MAVQILLKQTPAVIANPAWHTSPHPALCMGSVFSIFSAVHVPLGTHTRHTQIIRRRTARNKSSVNRISETVSCVSRTWCIQFQSNKTKTFSERVKLFSACGNEVVVYALPQWKIKQFIKVSGMGWGACVVSRMRNWHPKRIEIYKNTPRAGLYPALAEFLLY
jgi:hypothetical protein